MFAFYLFVIGVSIEHGLSQGSGDNCNQDGVPGVCRNLGGCPSLLADPKKRFTAKRCGFEGFEVIICCVDTLTTTSARPVATTPRPGTTTTEFVPPVYDHSRNQSVDAGCAPLVAPVAKTGRKAWDKCIDYQQELLYPCEQTLSGSMGRANRCNHNIADELIIGGTNAEQDEFPHMVLLGYGQSKSHRTAVWQCGGTLLSDRFILTAGHCTSSRDLGPVAYAITGRQNNVSDTQVHRIRRIIRHPQYKPLVKYHDIALLETEDPALLQLPRYCSASAIFAETDTVGFAAKLRARCASILRRVRDSRNTLLRAVVVERWDSPVLKRIKLDFTTVPACLDIFGGDQSKAVAPGWGAKSWMGSNGDYLEKVTLNRFKEEECRAKYKPRRFLEIGFDSTTQLCYGDYTKSKDTCQGDGGDPLIIQTRQIHCMYTVIGVTSFGTGCGKKGEPDVYTKVSHYADWIESIVFA